MLSATGDEVLLNLHGKARRWFAFGGHVEPGDATLAGAALREAHEESGVAGLDLHPEPVHLDEHVVGFCDPRGDVHHLDVRFAARAPAGVRPEVSDESLDVRWWPVDALPDEPRGRDGDADPERARTPRLSGISACGASGGRRRRGCSPARR